MASLSSYKPPLVLVIDDEVGNIPNPDQNAHLGLSKLQERWAQKRAEYCKRFGLLPSEAGEADIESLIARVIFAAPLEWIGESFAVPSFQAPLKILRDSVDGSTELISLILLDIQVDYGEVLENGTFASIDREFGLRSILPEIHAMFGTDETGPGTTWTRFPVAVVSGLPKHQMDEDVRRAGGRGMIAKQTDPIEARKLLSGYLTAHGLIPDSREIVVGRSLSLLNALAAARRAASSRSSVLILGESGTGKELLARYTHDHSPRASGPYGVYHAAGRGDELQEDELFGHWAGAFTGATRDQPGLLEELNRGTVFIDELGDIAPRVQNSLLRPLQERETVRIGRPRGSENRPFNLDLKFLFATNKDLDKAVAEGSFRNDLLQRISETTVKLPPLRERRLDIPLLAKALLNKIDDDLEFGASHGVRHYFDQDALDYLQTLDYVNGNVREFRSLILQVALAHPGEPRLTQTDFRHSSPSKEVSSKTLPGSELLQEKQVDALRRWVAEGPEAISHGELRQLALVLRGSAPFFIVTLLEVAVTAARLDGRPSLKRVINEFWGKQPATPQEARRALMRLLSVDWQNGTVAQNAAQSRILCEFKVHDLAKDVLKLRGQNDS